MQLGLGRNSKFPLPVGDESLLGRLFLSHPKECWTAQNHQTGFPKKALPGPKCQQGWAWEPFPDLDIICLQNSEMIRGAGLAIGQLVGASLGFLPRPPSERKENGIYDSESRRKRE